MTDFACRLTDADMVRGAAPEQPERVEVGQRWMHCVSGEIYPASRVGGAHVTLGSGSYMLVMNEKFLRREYVYVEGP